MHHSLSPLSPLFLFSLLLLLSLPSLSSALCNKQDKAALLSIKSFFHNPPGLSSWSSKTPCCTSWPGVNCNTTTGRVIFLTVFALNISSPIPPFIANLTSLQSLNLAYNRLYGPIPSFLGLLPELTFLRLDGNLLTGSIPSTLTIFDLSLVGNRLTGPLPASFAKANFGDLDLDYNKLTGDASFLFGKDKNLNALHISNNKFKFDLSKVEIPKVMDILVIDHNEIYGRIPADVAERKWLQLDVSYNRLCGPIPQGKYVQKFSAKHFDHNKCLCGAPLAPCK